jgi:hypothetical protein
MKQRTLSAWVAFAFGLLSMTLITSMTLNTTASVAGFVWNDLNTNGIQDAGEPGLDTVWVFLNDLDGNQIAATFTDVAGFYSFNNVPAGDYFLRFANPGGVWQTLQNQGNDDSKDSDADPLGFTEQFSILDGQTLDFDAGFTTTPQGCFTPVSVTISAINCNDNGTPDPNDDTFTFAVTATGGTGPWGWDLPPANLMMIPYGTPYTFGPFQIVNGAITLTINDHDNPACVATFTVNPPAPCSSPLPPDNCDEKIIGCIKYELLDITLDAEKNRTYRIRVTNSCTNKLIYTAFQLPDGVTAMNPPDNSIYTAPSGREYAVRNPNFSPFYSIRFKSVASGISNGESDIFSYKLPAQSAPDYIHVISRVYPKIFYEAHLNTFDCVPINSRPEVAQEVEAQNSFSEKIIRRDVGSHSATNGAGKLKIFPNPSAGALYADLSPWKGQTLKISMLNSQGNLLHSLSTDGGSESLPLDIANDLPNGLYFVEIIPATGERQVQQIVLQR